MTAQSVLAHRVDGNGAPVILLNGGMMSISSWDAIAQPLARTHRVIRCDFRGHFLSPGPPYRGTLEDHADDVADLLDALGVERAHVIGTSFGGEVAVTLAARHANRVSSLIAATAADFSTPELLTGLTALRQFCHEALGGGSRVAMMDLLMAETYSPAFLEANREMLASRRNAVAALPDEWFRGTASILDAIIPFDLRPLLPRVACPTLVVSAALDRIMSAERSRGLVDGIAGAHEIVVADSGHGLVYENPAEFTRICVEFLHAHS